MNHRVRRRVIRIKSAQQERAARNERGCLLRVGLVVHANLAYVIANLKIRTAEPNTNAIV